MGRALLFLMCTDLALLSRCHDDGPWVLQVWTARIVKPRAVAL